MEVPMFVTIIWSLFTLFISTVNAVVVGSVWRLKDQLSGWMKFILWSGRIMAVIGFAMVLLIAVVLLMANFGIFEIIALYFNVVLSPSVVLLLVETIFNLNYLLIVFPVIGLGLGITVHSWISFRKDQGLLSGGVALYNTAATAYNIFNAFQFVPTVVKGLYESVGKSKLAGIPLWLWCCLILAPIAISFGGAILITNWIMSLAGDRFPELQADDFDS